MSSSTLGLVVGLSDCDPLFFFGSNFDMSISASGAYTDSGGDDLDNNNTCCVLHSFQEWQQLGHASGVGAMEEEPVEGIQTGTGMYPGTYLYA